jgi:hypothetical protein
MEAPRSPSPTLTLRSRGTLISLRPMATRTTRRTRRRILPLTKKPVGSGKLIDFSNKQTLIALGAIGLFVLIAILLVVLVFVA